MKDHTRCIRGFYHLSEAWYAEANRGSTYTDEVMFGLYAPEGGCEAEMCVRWSELGGESVPQLQAFDDSWAVLASFKDLIDELALINNQNITPKQFCALLDRLGFQDQTPRKNPYGSNGDRPKRETMLENTLGAIVDLIESDDVSVIPDDTEIHSHTANAKRLLGRK